MGERNETKEPGGLGWSPLSRGTVRERYHHGLKILAHDLELAHGLELHGLSSEVLLGRDGVSEDVQEQGGGAGSVYAEGDSVTNHRLKYQQSETIMETKTDLIPT